MAFSELCDPFLTYKARSQHINCTDLNWPDLYKSTQLHEAYIGHADSPARQRYDLP